MNIFKKVGAFFLKSKLRLAVLLVVLIVILIYLWATSSGKNPPQTSSGTPTLTKTPSVQEQQVLQQSKTQLIAKLPIDAEQYLIEYFPDRDYFFVQIRKTPYSQYKAQVESLFRQNGVDLSHVTIEWGSVRGVGP